MTDYQLTNKIQEFLSKLQSGGIKLSASDFACALDFTTNNVEELSKEDLVTVLEFYECSNDESLDIETVQVCPVKVAFIQKTYHEVFSNF